MTMTEDRKLHRWSEDDEARRLSFIAAGVEPHLYKWWISSSTGELRDALAEYSALNDMDPDLDECIDQLRMDIAYRTQHLVRPYVNVERYETMAEAEARAVELYGAYAIPFAAFASQSVGMFSVVVAP